MMLQMLTPVTPLIPKKPAMMPPTIAPTTPRAMSIIMPEPVLLTSLLAIQPAIRPRMIQLIMPMSQSPPSAGRTPVRCRRRRRAGLLRDGRGKRKQVVCGVCSRACAVDQPPSSVDARSTSARRKRWECSTMPSRMRFRAAIWRRRSRWPRAAPPPSVPTNAPAGSIVGGLSDLIGKLTAGGAREHVNSWVGPGENQPIQPGQLGGALGQNTLNELSQRTGMSQQELLQQLSLVLPQLINNLTPKGRMPTVADLEN